MGYTKPTKQTEITAASAVSTVKDSPKEKCHENYDRFRFREKSGFQGERGPVGFLGLLFYFSHYYLGFGLFRAIAYLGSCHFFSMIRKTSLQQSDDFFFSSLVILTLSLLHGEAELIRIQPLSPSLYRLSGDVQGGI